MGHEWSELISSDKETTLLDNLLSESHSEVYLELFRRRDEQSSFVHCNRKVI